MTTSESLRGQTIQLSVPLVTETCCSCGVLFAMTADLEKRRRDDHDWFYCPNGHGQHYTGKTEAQKLRDQLREVEKDRDWYRDAERNQREFREQAERSLSATRGQVTKLRKRVVAGTCPFGCRRHFADLERHVASKHEGQTLEAEHA